MSKSAADLHRSRLETILAIEIEAQKRMLALSNQRIQNLKKLLTDLDAMYVDPVGDEVISGLSSLLGGASSEATPVSTDKGKKKKARDKKKKKAAPPAKPVKLVAGKVPRLIDALQMVMRSKQMGAKEAYTLLKARKWLPNSKDPLSYIRFTLSDEHEIFHRVEGKRGVYQLDPSNPYFSGKGKKPEAEAELPQSPPKVVSAPPPPPSVGESEPPPAITDDDSHQVVDAILSGSIPVDD